MQASDGGGEELFGGGAGGDERGFEGVEHGHEFVHLGDDPALFREGREGERHSPKIDHGYVLNCYSFSFRDQSPLGLWAFDRQQKEPSVEMAAPKP